MEKLKLISINADGIDAYIVGCGIDGREVSYKFTFFVNASGSRVLEHEDSFYSLTYDDPAAEWLEKSILAFDRARLKARADSRPEPRTLMVVSTEGMHQYKVISQDESAEAEELITIAEKADTRIANWKFGNSKAKLEPPGLWIADTNADSLLEAVLMLHQAIYPKYKIESDAC